MRRLIEAEGERRRKNHVPRKPKPAVTNASPRRPSGSVTCTWLDPAPDMNTVLLRHSIFHLACAGQKETEKNRLNK